MDPAARHTLHQLLERYGLTLANHPARLHGLLLDYYPQERPVWLLAEAARRGAATLGNQPPAAGHRLAERLQTELKITAEEARWAVESWAEAAQAAATPPATPITSLPPTAPLGSGGRAAASAGPPAAPSMAMAPPPRRSNCCCLASCLLAFMALLVGAGIAAVGVIYYFAEVEPRLLCADRLRQIGAALQSHEGRYGCLPPAAILGPDGKPWHSWRVLILPELGRQDLYDAYRFDEPWDGPNNRQLQSQIPEVYADPYANDPTSGLTPTLAVVGDARGFKTVRLSVAEMMSAETRHGGRKFSEFRDGLSDTIIVAYRKWNAQVPWIQPDALVLRDPPPTPGMNDGFACQPVWWQCKALVLRADGSVAQVPEEISSEALRAMLTIDGNDVVRWNP